MSDPIDLLMINKQREINDYNSHKEILGSICAVDPKMYKFLISYQHIPENLNALNFGKFRISVERNITAQTKLIMQKITDSVIDCDVEKILYTDQSHPDTEIINLKLAENYCHASKIFDATTNIKKLVLKISEVFNLPMPGRIFLGNKMYRFNNMD